jgi:hypothetical protein
MPTLPVHGAAPLVRTHFGEDRAWAALLTAVGTPSAEGFLGNVQIVEDRTFDGLDTDAALAALPADANVAVLFLADAETLTHPDSPILVVRVLTEPGRTFRVVPEQLWSVENNLSLANLDWADYAGRTDDAGIFRGF